MIRLDYMPLPNCEGWGMFSAIGLPTFDVLPHEDDISKIHVNHLINR